MLRGQELPHRRVDILLCLLKVVELGVDKLERVDESLVRSDEPIDKASSQQGRNLGALSQNFKEVLMSGFRSGRCILECSSDVSPGWQDEQLPRTALLLRGRGFQAAL